MKFAIGQTAFRQTTFDQTSFGQLHSIKLRSFNIFSLAALHEHIEHTQWHRRAEQSVLRHRDRSPDSASEDIIAGPQHQPIPTLGAKCRISALGRKELGQASSGALLVYVYA
jgi:hypothetical protein